MQKLYQLTGQTSNINPCSPSGSFMVLKMTITSLYPSIKGEGNGKIDVFKELTPRSRTYEPRGQGKKKSIQNQLKQTPRTVLQKLSPKPWRWSLRVNENSLKREWSKSVKPKYKDSKWKRELTLGVRMGSIRDVKTLYVSLPRPWGVRILARSVQQRYN